MWKRAEVKLTLLWIDETKEEMMHSIMFAGKTKRSTSAQTPRINCQVTESSMNSSGYQSILES